MWEFQSFVSQKRKLRFFLWLKTLSVSFEFWLFWEVPLLCCKDLPVCLQDDDGWRAGYDGRGANTRLMEISCAILQTAPLSVRARVCLCQRQYKDLITLQHNLRSHCSTISDHTAAQSQITLQCNLRSHCSTISDHSAAQSQITLQHNHRSLYSTISDHVYLQVF